MVKTDYIRDGKRIQNTATGKVETFKYFNAAKRASRKLQAEGATLRLGAIKINS